MRTLTTYVSSLPPIPFDHDLSDVPDAEGLNTEHEATITLALTVEMGAAATVDFPAARKVLEEIGYNRWVTAVPGNAIPGQEDPLSEATRSKQMVDYLRGIGY